MSENAKEKGTSDVRCFNVGINVGTTWVSIWVQRTQTLDSCSTVALALQWTMIRMGTVLFDLPSVGPWSLDRCGYTLHHQVMDWCLSHSANSPAMQHRSSIVLHTLSYCRRRVVHLMTGRKTQECYIGDQPAAGSREGQMFDLMSLVYPCLQRFMKEIADWR